jgi:hypothetical protein
MAFRQANRRDFGGGDLQDEIWAAKFLADTGTSIVNQSRAAASLLNEIKRIHGLDGGPAMREHDSGMGARPRFRLSGTH